MDAQRSPETGYHQIITERDKARAAQSLENLHQSNVEMETFITTVWENNRRRRKAVLAAGAVTALGLIGLGLALFKKTGPVQ